MPELMFGCSFLLLVLLPCIAAVLGMRFDRAGLANIEELAFFPPKAMGAAASPFCALGEERQVAEKFEIRSFPKGLAVRRNLLRDGALAVSQAVEKVLAAPTVTAAAKQMVAGVAAVGAETGVYPRTNRRVLMLQMLADKAEADAWSAKAAMARHRRSTLERTAAPEVELRLVEEERRAREAAREAFQRVHKCEALLQRRADLEMRTSPKAGERHAAGEARSRAA